jgi:predicted restriction endonuclease
MKAAECDYTDLLTAMSTVEMEENDLRALIMMDDKYRNLTPEQRNIFVNAHLDRGSTIIRAIKNLLGAKCQICGYEGFEKLDGNKYIEAHHLSQLALLSPGSLCSDNIILVCPNCHREIHYGKYVEVSSNEKSISIKLGSSSPVVIMKNSIENLKNQRLSAG